MRNPNGYGSIINLGKGRRRPFGVRVTRSYEKGPDGTFRQKYDWLGYFKTKKEALGFLAKFNEHRQPVTEFSSITFAKAWENYLYRNPIEPGTSRYNSYTSAYKKCEVLYNRKMQDLRLTDLEDVFVEHQGSSASSLTNIKIVMIFIFNWAIQNDVINKNYAEMVDIRRFKAKETENHHRIPTETVMEMWKKSEEFKLELMYIYTGCRANELLQLPKANVDLINQYFKIDKSKTKAGIRIVPIADCVLPFFKYYFAHSEGNNLINVSYANYSKNFMAKLPGFKPHDTRVTCKSLLVEAKVPEVISKKILGHNIGNVSGDIYTQLEPKTLLEAVNSIKLSV